MKSTELRKKVLYALAVASVATIVQGGVVGAVDTDHILVKGDNINENNVTANGGYWYGVVGGNAYIDNTATDENGNPVHAGLPGTVNGIHGLLTGNVMGGSSLGQLAGLDQSIINAVGDINTVLQKTEGATAQTTMEGNAGLNLQNYGHDWVRYYGAVGGDLSVNTGLKGKLSSYLNKTEAPLLQEATETNIIRTGDINNVITSGSVIGGVGGSAAAALGNISAAGEYSKTVFIITAKVEADIQLDGKTSTTVNGNVSTGLGADANTIGWMNGGLAAGLGGTAVSTINGTSTVTIDGTNRAPYTGVPDEPQDDAIPPITTALNVMKGSGVNAIGVTGGGTALTTLGGEATSTVNGMSTVNIKNATILGAIGGGVAGAVDATDIGDVLADKLDPNHPPVGNDDGTSDVSGSQLEDWLGTSIPDNLKITANKVNNGGVAKSVTGDTYVNVTSDENGNSTAIGVLGGGAAVATHTYIGKYGDNQDKVVGASQASAETGRATITIDLQNKLQESDKSAFMGALADLKHGIASDSTQADVLKPIANKGAVGGVFGGGAALAYGSVATKDYTYDADNLTGAEAISTTKGADINLVNGYAAGIMGGGIAGTRGNAYAQSDMTDTVNINIGNFEDTLSADSVEAVGVFGNGMAYYTGSSVGGTQTQSGKAVVTAKDTNVNVYGGSVDGIIGGGMAIDDSDAHRTNAIAETSGKATINVSGSAVVNTANLDALNGMVGNVPADGIDMASYVDGVKAAAGNAAIAAGGIALGGGAEAYVKESEVNIAGGTVDGNIYGGGIAAYGYNESTGDGETKGSRVYTATINLTGGEVNGNVYAGGAVATQTSDGAAVYGGYDKAAATVGTAVVNLAGTDVKGILYGAGTINQVADAASAQVWVGESTLNISGENTLSNVLADKTTASKIQAFDNVNVAANSVTKLDNSVKPGTEALIDGGTITVDSTARLDISALDKTGSPAYNIAANYNEGSTFWSDDNLIYDRMAAYATSSATAGGNGQDSQYTITYDSINESNWKDAADSMGKALNAGPVQPLVDQGMRLRWDTNQGISEGAREYFRDWMYNPNMNAAFGRGMMVGEDSAVTGNTVSITRDMADEVAQHLSFTEDFVQDHDSIYGDDNIWAKYIHNKFETDGMSGSFGGITADNDYNGVIVGYDFSQSGKLQSGIAFHYGHGDGTGSFTRNDFDAWGVSLYGALKDETAGTNLMADIGYTKTTNDITGRLNGKDLTADRDLSAWTIGVRGEKEFVSGHNQIVPYVGLRYMNVDPSSYTSYYGGKKAFEYDADKQDIWMVPLGVSFRNETKTRSGWRITPKLDVAYIWAFGDTDNEVDVNMAGASAPLYYTVMDDGSWLASLGLDASHGAWTFGAGYAYQKGDDTKNNKWYVNAGFAF